MPKKDIHPKLRKTAEEYLASLNSSQEQLTDKQWEILINHIKVEHQFKWVTPCILVLGLLLACLSIFSFIRASDCITSAVPENTIYVITEPDRNPITLEPEYIRNYLEYLRKMSWNSAAGLVNATLLFVVVTMRFVLSKHRRKYIEALVERRDSAQTSSTG
jgi:hypothetical protein